MNFGDVLLICPIDMGMRELYYAVSISLNGGKPMGMWGRILLSAAVVAGTAMLESPAACADDFDWKDGKWRLELSGFAGYRSGRRSRTGDFGFAGSVEYEVPLASRLTFGIKAYPLFFYDQDDAGEDTLFGAGVGPELRVYSKGAEHRGFFAELGTAVLATVGRFDGNSGAVNLLIEGGLGYKFERNWHVAVKFRHISNVGFAARNSGLNGLGLAFGYSF